MAKKNIKSKSKISKVDKASKKTPKWFTYTMIGVVAALLLVAAGLAIYKYANKPKQQVAASVNGEIITLSELDDIYNRLPDQTKTLVTKEDLLEQMINEELLVQQAKKEGIEVTNNETDEFLNTLLLQSGLTKEEFEERIASQNITIEMVNDEIYKQLVITKLYEKAIINKTEVSEQEIQDYYNENKDLFETQEQVSASHILICYQGATRCESNITKEEALAKAEEVKAMINSTNFGELAVKYSTDPTAKDNEGDLGYFPRGVMVQEFEDAAFALDNGEVSGIVETSFGYHILKSTGKKPAAVQPLSDVKDEIEEALLSEKQQEAFKDYLEKIKADSQIINFYAQNLPATTS